MLTDFSIFKCQKKKIKNEFHAQYGLQHIVFRQKLRFKEKNGEFRKILHNRNYHWVVIYNINCSKNEINKNEINYSSLFHGKTKDHVKMQFSTFLNPLVKT